METVTIRQDGRITIPVSIREQLGLRLGSQMVLIVVGDHIELRIDAQPPTHQNSGFGLLKSLKKAVPVDLDPADLLKS